MKDYEELSSRPRFVQPFKPGFVLIIVIIIVIGEHLQDHCYTGLLNWTEWKEKKHIKTVMLCQLQDLNLQD